MTSLDVVYALDAASGRARWAFKPGNGVGSAVIGADGTVYVVVYIPAPVVNALDGTTGQKKWASIIECCGAGTPALGGDGTLYIGLVGSKKVYAMDGANGGKRWEFLAGAEVWSSPVIGPDGTLYVGAEDHKVYAIDGFTGRKKWESVTGDWVRSSPAIGADGTIYVGSADQQFYALDGVTGRKKWEFMIGDQVYASPTIGLDGTIYIGGGTRFCALESSSVGGLADGPWPKARGNAANTGAVRGPETKDPPAIRVEPADVRVPQKALGVLYVVADGQKPFSYQWFFAGTALPGATNAVLRRESTRFTDTGSYFVTVSNAFGLVTSRTAKLIAGYELKLTIRGGGAVSRNPDFGVHEPGQTVTLTAVPSPGRRFIRWSGDVSSQANPLVVTMDGPNTVIAEFSLGPGDHKWEFQTGGAIYSCPAIGTDGTIYFGSKDQRVYALDGVTGQKKWAFSTGGQIWSSPAIGPDGTVYIGSDDKNVYALEGATGQKKWAFTTEESVRSCHVIGTDGTVFFRSGFTAYALEGATGRARWNRWSSSVSGSPSMGTDGTLYVGGVALDGGTGEFKMWRPACGCGSMPTIGAEGTIYLGTGAGATVCALEGTLGGARWGFPTGGEVWSAPVSGPDGAVYVGSYDHKVYALDGLTGHQKWEFVTGDRVDASPAIGLDGTIYVGSMDQKLYALDGATGQKKWECRLGGAVYYGSPTIGDDGTIYVGAGNTLYAVESSSVGGLASGLWSSARADAKNTGRAKASKTKDAPVIRYGPDDVRAPVGGAAELTVEVKGQTPLQYQWFYDGTPLPKETNAILRRASVQVADTGNYFVTVKNSFGAVASRVARLTVGYELNLTLQGNGSVNRNPNFAVYEPDQTVTLTALPATGGRFIQWSGAVSGQANPGVVTVDGPKAVVAEFSSTSGDQRWEFTVKGGVTTPLAIGADGMVYVTTGTNVIALDGATGQKQWEFDARGNPLGAGRTIPAIGADGTVYIPMQGYAPGSFPGLLSAVDGKTGGRKWVFSLGEHVFVNPPAIGADSTVFVSANGGQKYVNEEVLYALTSAGQKKWVIKNQSSGGPFGGVAICSFPSISANGEILIFFGRTNLVLDGATGIKKRERGRDYGDPIMDAENNLYAGSSSGEVFAADGATGAAKWVYPLMSNEGISFEYSGAAGQTAALGYGGTLYFTVMNGYDVTVRRLVALNSATGLRKWEFKTTANLSLTPTVGNDGAVYVGSQDGRIYAIDGMTGQVWRQREMGGAVHSSPAIGPDGTLYVVRGEKLIALEVRGLTGLADSPWPKVRGNAQNTGNVQTKPRILEAVESRVCLAGTGLVMETKVSGIPSPTLQWLLNGQPIAGATNATFALVAITDAQAGTYSVVASNSAGTVTNVPAIVAVNNVVASNYPGLLLTAPTGTPVQIQYAEQIHGPWQPLMDLTLPANPHVVIDLSAAPVNQRFYRTTDPNQLTALLLPGWTFTAPAGSHYRIEFIEVPGDLSQWHLLTNLTLSESPHLFIDTTATNRLQRYYRTTVVQ